MLYLAVLPGLAWSDTDKLFCLSHDVKGHQKLNVNNLVFCTTNIAVSAYPALSCKTGNI